MKGFWSDQTGLSIDELAAIMVLPLFLFVGVKFAIAKSISSTQVDFFTVLTYPILAVVARQAVEKFGFPVMKGNLTKTVPQTYVEPAANQQNNDQTGPL